MQRIAPDRVLLYGCVDTFDEDRGRVFASMERMVEQGAVGFKFYPSNGFFDVTKHKLVQMLYDDPQRAFPFFEKARELGVMHLAFHKAQPVGPGPVDAVHYEDLSTAALAFPDMTFEVVHAGWAFLEEAGIQLMLHDNIYANLECVVNLVVRHPRRFAHIIGTLLRYGGAERILYATGCAVNHSDPILERFMAFEMPEDPPRRLRLSGGDHRRETADAGSQHREHPRHRHSGHREEDQHRPLEPTSRARQGAALERASGKTTGRRGGVLIEIAVTMRLQTEDQAVAYIRDQINEVTDPCSQAQGVAIGLCDMGPGPRTRSRAAGRWVVGSTDAAPDLSGVPLFRLLRGVDPATHRRSRNQEPWKYPSTAAWIGRPRLWLHRRKPGCRRIACGC